jgi:hypothetical protein
MADATWSPEHDVFLQSYLNILGVKCCSRHLNMPPEAIRQRAAQLKIKSAPHDRSGQWKEREVEVLEQLLRAAVRLTGHRADAVVRRMGKLLEQGFLAENFDDEVKTPVSSSRRAFPVDGGPHVAG